MAVKIHKLKIAPKYLEDVVSGQKKAELRKNDRNYRRGDLLLLCEWLHGEFTGREWAAVVTHILPVNEVVKDTEKWVVLSIDSITPLEAMAYAICGSAK